MSHPAFSVSIPTSSQIRGEENTSLLFLVLMDQPESFLPVPFFLSTQIEGSQAKDTATK